ncbi:MAG: ExbD/TolR family protein [Planctomycetota bacterium]|jgi:biopolymer transport protein ExbD
MPLKVTRDDELTMNLTPMIDVVFLLIIFFMVGSRFSEISEAERDITLSVPAVSKVETLTQPPRNRVINVYADGKITLDKEPVTLAELAQRLVAARNEYKQTSVVIRGDGQALHQSVADVLATCRQAEIVDMSIAVRPQELR